jgi:hypothetical protein
LYQKIQLQTFRGFDKLTFPIAIQIQFVGAKKQKQLIKITKVADNLVLALGGKELLVSINEDLMDALMKNRELF